MTLARGRGRITVSDGQAIVVARCPLCGGEHRYNKGPAAGEEIASIRKAGFTDEWMPCQKDLPGNYWRVATSGRRQGSNTAAKRRGQSSDSA